MIDPQSTLFNKQEKDLIFDLKTLRKGIFIANRNYENKRLNASEFQKTIIYNTHKITLLQTINN